MSFQDLIYYTIRIIAEPNVVIDFEKKTRGSVAF